MTASLEGEQVGSVKKTPQLLWRFRSSRLPYQSGGARGRTRTPRGGAAAPPVAPGTGGSNSCCSVPGALRSCFSGRGDESRDGSAADRRTATTTLVALRSAGTRCGEVPGRLRAPATMVRARLPVRGPTRCASPRTIPLPTARLARTLSHSSESLAPSFARAQSRAARGGRPGCTLCRRGWGTAPRCSALERRWGLHCVCLPLHP